MACNMCEPARFGCRQQPQRYHSDDRYLNLSTLPFPPSFLFSSFLPERIIKVVDLGIEKIELLCITSSPEFQLLEQEAGADDEFSFPPAVAQVSGVFPRLFFNGEDSREPPSEPTPTVVFRPPLSPLSAPEVVLCYPMLADVCSPLFGSSHSPHRPWRSTGHAKQRTRMGSTLAMATTQKTTVAQVTLHCRSRRGCCWARSSGRRCRS